MPAKRITNRQIPDYVAGRPTPFRANSTTGDWFTYVPNTGILPGDVRATFIRECWDGKAPVYVVHSYLTPIAWFTDAGGWVVPEVRYSVTTSRVQSLVRRGVSEFRALLAS